MYDSIDIQYLHYFRWRSICLLIVHTLYIHCRRNSLELWTLSTEVFKKYSTSSFLKSADVYVYYGFLPNVKLAIIFQFFFLSLFMGVVRMANNWASEVSPTLGCSIEILRDIYVSVGQYVCRMSN